eukprot:162076_1
MLSVFIWLCIIATNIVESLKQVGAGCAGSKIDCGDSSGKTCYCNKYKECVARDMVARVINTQYDKIKPFKPYCAEYNKIPGLTVKMQKQPELLGNPFNPPVKEETPAQFKKHFSWTHNPVPLEINQNYNFIILLNEDKIRYYNYNTHVILENQKRNPMNLKYGHTSMLHENEWDDTKYETPFVRYAGSFSTNGHGYINSMDNGSGHYEPDKLFGPIIAGHWGFHQFFASWAHLQMYNEYKEQDESSQILVILYNINLIIFIVVIILMCCIIYGFCVLCGIFTTFITPYVIDSCNHMHKTIQDSNV